MILKVKLVPITVRKTSKFDKVGMPIYTVNADIVLKSEMPKLIEEAK